MELLQENSNNSCTDCLWKQRELRMTKEDLKYLQSQSHQKSNGKQFYYRQIRVREILTDTFR